jgi:hypothetical protein
MSLTYSCHSALSIDETRKKITEIEARYAQILQYFWVSAGGPLFPELRRHDEPFGFTSNCCFLIAWSIGNDGAPYYPEIPNLFYEAFGRENLLVFDNEYEYVPPSGQR